LDPTGEFCHVGQSGPVFFLAGNFGGTTVRHCTVPAGKALFFPILNYFWVQFRAIRLHIPELRDIVRTRWIMPSSPVKLTASPFRIQPATARNPQCSPPRCRTEISSDSTRETTRRVLDNGCYLMLSPLSKGRHTIHFSGETADHSSSGEVTYHLTVE